MKKGLVYKEGPREGWSEKERLGDYQSTKHNKIIYAMIEQMVDNPRRVCDPSSEFYFGEIKIDELTHNNYD